MTINKNVKWFDITLQKLRDKNLLRKLTLIDSAKGSNISIAGKHFINFSSNDYLGLSQRPEIIKSAVSALKKYGFGSGSSRLLSGTCIPHKKLEEHIAEFKKTESALLFNTGYAANTGIIPALAGAGWTILSDELNHASIIDGLRLSKAEIKIYRHRDINHLEVFLKKSAKNNFIVTDAVFSMDGDIAPLKEIAFLSKKYKALLMIDDAHGTGVLGRTGRGTLEHLGIRDDGIIQMGTLSKALGCFGAFTAGPSDLINLLINKARSFIYSTSLPPAVAGAGIKAIDIVDFKSANLRKKLWHNRQRLSDGLEDLGYNTFDSETPIIPILAGTAENALKLSRYLYKNKIFAPAIRPPTVPEGKCRIRFSVTALHTDEDIDRVLECLRKLK